MKQIADPLVVGLVLFGVGDYRQIMNMDFESAVHTYAIHYINRINENLAVEAMRNKKG